MGKERAELKTRPPPRTYTRPEKDDLFKPDRKDSGKEKQSTKKSTHVYDRFIVFDFSGTVGRKGYNPIKEVSSKKGFYNLKLIFLHYLVYIFASE